MTKAAPGSSRTVGAAVSYGGLIYKNIFEMKCIGA